MPDISSHEEIPNTQKDDHVEEVRDDHVVPNHVASQNALKENLVDADERDRQDDGIHHSEKLQRFDISNHKQ